MNFVFFFYCYQTISQLFYRLNFVLNFQIILLSTSKRLVSETLKVLRKNTSSRTLPIRFYVDIPLENNTFFVEAVFFENFRVTVAYFIGLQWPQNFWKIKYFQSTLPQQSGEKNVCINYSMYKYDEYIKLITQ